MFNEHCSWPNWRIQSRALFWPMAILILRVRIDFTFGHLNPLYQVQGLGFSGEIGYQSFLYPSEREVNPLHMFSL